MRLKRWMRGRNKARKMDTLRLRNKLTNGHDLSIGECEYLKSLMGTWTFNKPVERGFYWYREDTDDYPGPLVVLVYEDNSKWCADFPGDTTEFGLRELHGEWCGPIKPPE
jgi:hypothetical protein